MVQPLAPRAQVPRLVLEIHVVPAVQAFVQHDAEPAEPLHAPLVQVEVVQVGQPLATAVQVWRLVLDRHVVPAAFAQQAAEPAAPLHPFAQVITENS